MNYKSTPNWELGGDSITFDVKAVTAEGQIEGYASMFDQIDLGKDIVLKGAFSSSLERGSGRVRMLFQHDPSEPIGVWQSLAEDAKGLFAKGQLLMDTQRGREVHTMIKQGAVDGLSIGFKTEKAKYDSVKKARLIEKASLWEISVVTFPLLESARASVKSFDPRELEGALRDAGLSRADAVKAVSVFRDTSQCDAGSTEEGARDAAAKLMNNLRRLDSMFGK
jgi:HK97 family phage prohead protease